MDGIEAYKHNAVVTQSPGQVVVMLYDGAIRFIKEAIAATEAGDLAAKGTAVGKALDIIQELDCSLDAEAGGEIASDLSRMYDFMYRHLLQAHAQKNPDMMREVIALLQDLNEGWKAIAS